MPRFFHPFLLTLLLALPPASVAAAAPPRITQLFPPGGTVGATVQTTLTGANLADVQEVLLSGNGVKVEKNGASNATTCPLRVAISPDAEPGEREVRLITAGGVSNAGYLWVGLYPDLLEKEPNE